MNKRRLTIALACLVLPLASCDDYVANPEYCVVSTTSVPTPKCAANDLANARALWTSVRPAAYDITLQMSCFCIPDVRRPVIVSVSGSTVLSRVYADDRKPVPAEHASLFPSVDGLFDLLQAALNQTADRIEVTYDPTNGHPRTIGIDYRSGVADEERYYTVFSFARR